MKTVLFCIISLIAVACTDESGARRTLEGAGYTNIQFHGHDFFACSKSDDTCTEFTAVGPSGRPVKGAVGCGLIGCSKACTIRLK